MCIYLFMLIPIYYIILHHVGLSWLRKHCSWLAINDSRDHDRYLLLSITSTMARTSHKARKSTGAPAKKRKTLQQCGPSIQTMNLTTSKRSRTSDAADKVDPKRARILVNFQLLYHSPANSSSITNRILMSKRSAFYYYLWLRQLHSIFVALDYYCSGRHLSGYSPRGWCK